MSPGQLTDAEHQKVSECAMTLGMVLDHMSDLVAMLDTDGKRLYNSPSYAKVFGNGVALEGTDSFRDIHPDDRERVKRVFAETVATGAGQRMQYRFLLADGAVRHIESQGDVIKDDAGKVTRVVVVARDITERKEFEEKLEERNRQLVATVKELERRHRENVVLGKMGDMLQMCKSAAETRDVLAQCVDELFPGTTGHLYLRNFGNDLLESAAAWGVSRLSGDPVIGRDDCWGLRRGNLHVIDDPKSKLVCPHLIAPPGGACLCAPISGHGELLGMLHVQMGSEESYLPEAVRKQRLAALEVWALNVSEHIALALANVRLRDSLQAQAIRDPLTGLYNRRHMEHALEREILRAARSQRTLGVILVDLDHFKNFNDEHGHEAGDGLLRLVGDWLLRHVRLEDIACRYGGEEFVVILPELSPAKAAGRAEELRKGLRDLRLNHRGEQLRGVSVSAGVAAYPEHGRTAADLLRAADAAMYVAKRQGRDRVEIAAPVAG
jgi:diguanylate cyclase (GGDEF)-like protein/PAS domain S-box-containing protein